MTGMVGWWGACGGWGVGGWGENMRIVVARERSLMILVVIVIIAVKEEKEEEEEEEGELSSNRIRSPHNDGRRGTV